MSRQQRRKKAARLFFIAMIICVVGLVFWPTEFLSMLGALIVVVIGVYLWIRWKFYKVMEPLEDMFDALDSTELNLSITASCKFFNPDTETIRDELLGTGFHLVAVYQAPELDGMHLLAFANQVEGVYPLVIDTQYMGVITEFMTPYNDECRSTLTYSNTEIPDVMPKPPHRKLERFSGMAPLALLEKMRAERPKGNFLAIADEALADFIEMMYADDKIYVKEHYEQEARFDDELTEKFLTEIGWSAVEWNRKQHMVVFVHGTLSENEVCEMFMDALGLYGDLYDYDERYEAIERKAQCIAKKLPPMEAFSQMVDELSDGKITFLLELSGPVAAKVFLGAEAGA